MSQLKTFLGTIFSDPRGRELLKEAKEPAGAEEAADLYLSIGEKLGCTVSREELAASLKSREKIQQARAAEAEKDMKSNLSDADLASVAGGGNAKCADTFDAGEWCWATDSCSVVINFYSGNTEDDEDDTYSCSNDATALKTKTIYEGDGWWENVDKDCPGGWFDE